MLYSHDWLRAFVPHSLSATDVARLIGRHVATIDDLRALRQDLAPIVVARVVEAGRHPNSDHLWVTRVDDGSGTLQGVVCGAPNVVAGTLYPFARVGTVMPTGNKGGILIEKRKIRGEWSCGMLCSSRELGLGDDHDGIMPLDLDVPTGTPLLEALGDVGDTQLEVDVLPNRPDLLSHRGMARELAALTGVAMREASAVVAVDVGNDAIVDVPASVTGAREIATSAATVRLDDIEGCPRYMAIVIRGVAVGPSPAWLVQRLEAVGARSISNVVDATNYGLQAFGQPTHAFDLSRLERSTIVVRKARPGERLVTLDGADRALTPEMTVIADATRAVAIAGVMGGKDSEVTATTTDILLEVAYFDPRSVRRTRRALGLNTDASYRFERGVDAHATREALVAIAQLIVAVAGGRVDGAPIDVGEAPHAPAPVSLDIARGSRLLGAALTATEVRQRLGGIGFDVAGNNDVLQVMPPTWRGDVLRDADLVEEIARLQGFDTLSDTLRAFRPGTVPDHPFVAHTRTLRDVLVGEGLYEVRPLPFVAADDAAHVRVANPLAENEPHLRRTIVATLAARAEHNLARMEGNVRLFEVGSVFAPRAGGGLPVESLHAGALIMGASRPPHFTEPRPPAYDAWDARALGERMAHAVFGDVRAVPGEGEVLWTLLSGDSEVGRVLRLGMDRPVWAAEAFGVELWIGVLGNADVAPPNAHAASDAATAVAARAPHRFTALPTYPAAEFDLALVLPPAVTAEDVGRVIQRASGALLERLAVFDEYRGAGLPEGHRSVAWRLTFRDATRTLRDKEVEGRRAKILQTLEKELGIRPRSG
ncbi:MAG: phenylalanine--tRNA ligase subunit beta [Gemmatimonadaceae bacterium]|nr:phenylalanine--tRNA ligase subunit beta [Gemmatimonadaceae bacterium]